MFRFTSHSLLLPLLDVCLIIKVEEQEHHEQRLHECEEEENFRIIAVVKQRNAEVENKKCKLCQLQLCDVLLPPNRLPELGLVGCEEVVEVHHRVDNAIHVT